MISENAKRGLNEIFSLAASSHLRLAADDQIAVQPLSAAKMPSGERQMLVGRRFDLANVAMLYMLVVVLAAVRMTRADDVPAFARAVEGRIAAVARAQTLLADRHWSGAALRTLVEGSLAVFVPDSAAGRVRLDGPDLTLEVLMKNDYLGLAADGRLRAAAAAASGVRCALRAAARQIGRAHV